jgi:hypothetical protein
METNIRIVEFDDRLSLTVKRIELKGEPLADEQLQRACSRIAKLYKVAAIPFSSNGIQSLLIEVHETIPLSTLSVDDWVITLVATNDITRLSVENKKEQRLIADLYKRSLLIQVASKTDLWTIDSPRIFYEKDPFIMNDFTAQMSSTVTDIDAYRRFEISEMFIDKVGLGFSIGVRTAFFTNLSVDEYYGLGLEKRLRMLLGRQKEQKGTLLYDGPTGRLKCYFEGFKESTTIQDAPPFLFRNKSYQNPFEYFKQVHPSFKVNSTDKAALVSFPGMNKKVYVPANRLYVRVMNDMVDRSMSQADKILPDARMAMIIDFWKKVSEKPFGKNYAGLKSGFYKPDAGRSGAIQIPSLTFGQKQVLPGPLHATREDYRKSFKSRKEYLNKFGCYHVPPTMKRSIHFVFPNSMSENLRNVFSRDVCSRVKELTKFQVTPIIVTCADYSDGITELQSNYEPGMAVFIFEDSDPTTYYNIRYELKRWNIKRITKFQLNKRFRGLTDFKDGRFPKGESNWNSFVEINTYDIIQQLGCLPYVIDPTLHYDMQLMIDVSDKSSHIALSLVMFNSQMSIPLFDSLIRPKTDSLKETINPVFLEKYLIELFTKVRTNISKNSLNSLLVLRDGKDCGDEYDALKAAVAKLIQNGVFNKAFKYSFVEYHKSTLKEIRLLDESNGKYLNVLEGSYFLPDPLTAILATTGLGTLNQGTASPLMMKSKYGDCDMLKVIHDVFVTSQMNYSSPGVAQRLTFAAKRADEQLKDRIAQEVIRIK